DVHGGALVSANSGRDAILFETNEIEISETQAESYTAQGFAACALSASPIWELVKTQNSLAQAQGVGQ
ncbi:hypothetical protein ACQCQ6_26105, partial [Ralstonia pseudosolanacearum]|uniref:hypothetical protein n=1 Tax=Ralstonia pseudosolanacearum TaxID=1310165 RepID=UPI003CFB2B09